MEALEEVEVSICMVGYYMDILSKHWLAATLRAFQAILECKSPYLVVGRSSVARDLASLKTVIEGAPS